MTLALQLMQESPDSSVAVVERATYPVRESAHKVGESTVEIAAHYLRDVLGMNEHLEQEQIRKFGLRMFFGHEGNTDIVERRELGGSEFPLLATYQLDRGRLENELARRCCQAGIALITGRVTDIDLGSGEGQHRVTISGKDDAVGANWIVDATGRGAYCDANLAENPFPMDITPTPHGFVSTTRSMSTSGLRTRSGRNASRRGPVEVDCPPDG